MHSVFVLLAFMSFHIGMEGSAGVPVMVPYTPGAVAWYATEDECWAAARKRRGDDERNDKGWLYVCVKGLTTYPMGRIR